MDENKKSMLEFVENFRGTVCLGWSLELIRLLGFQETEEDYYYVAENPSGEIKWWSGCGWIVGLKGKVDDKEYEYLENRFQMLKESYLPLE